MTPSIDTTPVRKLPDHRFTAAGDPTGVSLHLADVTMFWAAESGGVKRYLRAKHDFLRSTHWRHTLVVPGTPDDASNEVAVVPGVPLPMSHGYRIPLRSGPAEQALCALSPDLIEAGDPYRLSWAALRAGARLQVPVAAFCHSDLPAFFRRLGGPPAELAATAYARKLYRHFDTVFVPSRYIAQKVADLGVERIELLPLGVDTRLFHPARRSLRWREQLDLPRDARVLLYVGRYAPEKNLQVLCDAVGRLDDGSVLVTIGSGPTPPRGRHVRALPYEGDAQHLAAAMASADVFVHAGDQETFGLVALEAMASGVPVVTCSAGGLGELVNAQVGYAVPHCRADDFAQALQALRGRDPVALAHAARRHALQYDWRAVLPQLLRRYLALLGRQASLAAEPSPTARQHVRAARGR
ncbi:GDP-mannose-dependent alpha-mannosyltransferase [Ralstonia mannitolilytica]|uniref:glycosyltransferase family 4 protein n=1 Tax=Ralstonia mannitolilytica TaxID=105219 RepID=UPI0028F5852B|nr:glycosyltransferase family 1 protein [Ralstonia mannitolilytica]CAJ0685797.1 GDP-mannose-dependent alpha-mannosyltransferase [Ralstonia mannitolilytica]